MNSENGEPGASRIESASMPYLVVLNGPSAGTRAALDRHLLIGRSSRCDLTLPGQMVSRTHAEVVRSGEDFILRDLGSVNGTLLNGSLVTKATLRHGDRITLGDTALKLEDRELDVESATTDSFVVMRSSSAEDGTRLRVRGEPSALQASLMSGDSRQALRAQERLEALVGVSERLTRLRELDELYPLVVDEVMRILPAERGALLVSSEGKDLEARCARHAAEPGGQVEVSRTILDEVVKHRQCVLSADALMDDAISVSESIMLHNIRSVLCVPIEYDRELLGVIYLDSPGRGDLFTEEDLHFVSGIAGVAAAAITNAISIKEVRSAHQELNHAYLAMLSVLANAIEARDHYTIGHTWRVARFAQVLARRLGWDEERVSEIEVGGMLHDIGKIGVPDSILTKAGALDDEEQKLMQLHTQIGARMISDVPSLTDAIPYVLHHHERWDGSGYPDRLKGQEIPLEARLLAVADALDAMTSDRPYRPGLDLEVALEELQREAGHQFDPEVVAALIQVCEAGELTPYLQAGPHEPRDVICPSCSTCCTPDDDAIDAGRTDCPTCKKSLVLRQTEGRFYAEIA